jgi:hypothetical protein
LLLAFSSVVAQDAGEIRNFLRVNKDFCTGGQPKLEHLEKLKADGVKSIINLRQPSEHRAAEEEAKAKELGLKYFNIPVAYGNPNEEQVAEFLKITDDPENRPGVHPLHGSDPCRRVLDDQACLARWLESRRRRS